MPENKTTPRINIVLIQPFGYTHSLALQEVGEYLKFKLERLGLQATFVKNRYDPHAINIILGAHLLESSEFLPPQTIIFNSEQAGANNNWTQHAKYLEILSHHYVWDYSRDNVSRLNPKHCDIVNFGHEETLQRLQPDAPKEFDLLFYGSMNPRREKIIQALTAKGIQVKTIFNLYAAERDFYIERSRAVLNLHFYDTQVFQQIRAFYPLINGVPVISEDYPATSAPAVYEDAVCKPNGQAFVEFAVSAVHELRKNSHAFDQQIQAFKDSASDTSLELAIQNAIRYFSDSQDKHVPIPQSYRKINLGSGKDYKPGYLNIDISELTRPDLILDLSKTSDFPIAATGTHGDPIVLDERQFDEIIANDVLEHVPDLQQLMTNCLQLLAEGGKMHINVPYDLSLGAWQDPTHIRGFNQNSWLYYTSWFWYLGWFEHCFELSNLTFNPSDYGRDLVNRKTPDHIVLSTPRAIDSMSVTLTKRKTTPEERTQARSFIGRII